MLRLPLGSTLFPYTTLFRSRWSGSRAVGAAGAAAAAAAVGLAALACGAAGFAVGDRKSTRLNSSHVSSSYAVFCLKKKKPYTTLSIYDHVRLCVPENAEVMV